MKGSEHRMHSRMKGQSLLFENDERAVDDLAERQPAPVATVNPSQSPLRLAGTNQARWQAPGFGDLRDDLDRAANAAHDAVTKTSWSDKARYLQQMFGQREAAVITGVSDAKTVGRWIRGDQSPQPAQQRRLAAAFQVAKLIELATSTDVARSWFLGMNPGLNDELPAQVIAEDIDEGGKRVMRAARTFLASQ